MKRSSGAGLHCCIIFAFKVLLEANVIGKNKSPKRIIVCESLYVCLHMKCMFYISQNLSVMLLLAFSGIFQAFITCFPLKVVTVYSLLFMISSN